jgi:Ca2+-dependent lipid-binding protein
MPPEARHAFQAPQTPALNDMPDSFSDLASAASIKDMTAEQISEGIEHYKSALSEAGQAVPAITPDQINKIHDSVTGELAGISTDIRKEYDASAKSFDEFETGIVKTATVTFGNAVGSSSFTYLLIVFAIVFVMIMLFPVLYRKYDNTVATNLIKSNFFLQLSTVFALTSAIIILGIGQFIDRQQLPVLLAAISGYVLGQLGKA